MGCGRWFLLVLGSILCLGFIRLGSPEEQPAVQFLPTETDASAVTAAPPSIELPCVVRGSRLIIEKLVSFEGDFWEDGSDRYVVDVMALVVYNPGNAMIRSAEISVQQGQRQLRFAISCLPPNSRVLVLERSGIPFSAEPLKACHCDLLTVIEPALGLTTTPAGPVSVQLRNQSDTSYPQIILCCKRYDADSDLYLGGITYITPAGPLAPGETTELAPARYVEGCSRIVCITATS